MSGGWIGEAMNGGRRGSLVLERQRWRGARAATAPGCGDALAHRDGGVDLSSSREEHRRQRSAATEKRTGIGKGEGAEASEPEGGGWRGTNRRITGLLRTRNPNEPASWDFSAGVAAP